MPWNLVEKQTIFDGKKLRVELHHLADEEGNHHRQEIAVHPGAVVIIPFISDTQILLIKNRRYAIGETLIELPAGTLEKGEFPMNCAGRELQEETGHLAGRLKPICNFFSSPGILTEKMYVFAAYDLQKTQTNFDAGEEIETVTVDWDRAIEMIQFGQIHDGKTITALLMYDRFFRSPGLAVASPTGE